MKANLYIRGTLWLIKASAAKRLGVPKDRPWLIVQNDELCSYRGRIACYITSALNKAGKLKEFGDTRVLLGDDTDTKLKKVSYVECGSIYTIRENEFLQVVGHISDQKVLDVKDALRVALDLL